MSNKSEKNQLFRFCLYGFLKNQLYLEPFLILAFLEKELDFLQIGFLISFRAISVNILEIPSGAIADVWGRRNSMILSMLGYIISFIIFALADKYWIFFPAMFMFAVGEAFRSGTHKAMIFDWLEHYGRESEKTRIYGLTRSWSKIGSALNVWIAAVVFITTKSYIWLFWASIIPYLFNILNFSFYPRFLDGAEEKKKDIPALLITLKEGMKLCLKKGGLRNLIFENISFEGYYSTAKEYLQPLLKAAAFSAPVMLAYSGEVRTALLVAIVYSTLYLLSSLASRKSNKAVSLFKSESKLSGLILLIALLIYCLSGWGMYSGFSIFPIIGFVILAVLLNIWKPVFVSRFYDLADKNSAATTLSISNQSKTLSVALIAPILGWLVDKLADGESKIQMLIPVAAFGIAFSLFGFAVHKINMKREEK